MEYVVYVGLIALYLIALAQYANRKPRPPASPTHAKNVLAFTRGTRGNPICLNPPNVVNGSPVSRKEDMPHVSNIRWPINY